MCYFFRNSIEYCTVQSITKTFQVYSGERSTKRRASDHRTFSEINYSNESTISSSTTFDKPPAKGCESPGPDGPTFSELNYINTIPISSTPLRSQDSLNDVVWPTFLNFPTEFEDGVWKCPICSHSTPRIRQHLTKNHKDDIKDWSAVETFCDEMAVLKRKECLKFHL